MKTASYEPSIDIITTIKAYDILSIPEYDQHWACEASLASSVGHALILATCPEKAGLLSNQTPPPSTASAK